MILDYLQAAYWMMWSKPVRSGLSLLGIYIGVLALFVILAIQEGARLSVEEIYRTQEAKVFLILPAFDQATLKMGALTRKQADEIKSLRGILSVMPRLEQEKDVRSLHRTTKAQVFGIDTGFIPVYRVRLLQGRNFLEREILFRQPVCLLTDRGAAKLFPLQGALGQFVEVEGTAFRVIGVVEWNSRITQRSYVGMDPELLLPVSWVDMPRDPVSDQSIFPMLEVRATPRMPVGEIQRGIGGVLSHGSAQRSKLYTISSLEDYLQGAREETTRMLKTLVAIAVISLLVGGIGVANVMLMSVTERTREIGIRKALGARRRDILFQFLVEAGVLAGAGGLIACLSGAAGIGLLPAFLHSPLPVVIPKWPAVGAFIFTFAIGLVAGAYPASLAAALSPAEALRYE